MPETISDTGPVLHLHEIGRLEGLATLVPLIFPNLVWEELQRLEVDRSALREAGLLDESTLHLSTAFRVYLKKLLAEVP